MKNKIIGIFVYTLLIIGFIIPCSAITIENLNNNISISGSFLITLHAKQYKINNLENKQAEILMQGYGNIITPGEPVLPVKTFFVGLPPGKKSNFNRIN